jgi:excisionase family DNA binding protein
VERQKVSGAIMSPLMTYQEAANYLRISLATIDRMVRGGELSSVLIRGRRLFRIRDLDEYIHSHFVPGGNKSEEHTRRHDACCQATSLGNIGLLDRPT